MMSGNYRADNPGHEYDSEWWGRSGLGIVGTLLWLLGLVIVGPLALGLAAVILSFPFWIPAIGYSMYLSVRVMAPWIVHALTAAAIPHGLAILIAYVPLLFLAAIVFAGVAMYVSHNIRERTLGIPSSMTSVRQGLRGMVQLPGGNELVSMFLMISVVFGGLASLGAAAYLTFLIAPAFAAALGLSGFAAGYAGFMLFVFLLVDMTIFLASPAWIFKKMEFLPHPSMIKTHPLQLLPYLGLFGGAALGVYSCTLVWPILTGALATVAMPGSALTFTAVILGASLVLNMSTFCFAGAMGISHLFDFERTPKRQAYKRVPQSEDGDDSRELRTSSESLDGRPTQHNHRRVSGEGVRQRQRELPNDPPPYSGQYRAS